MVGFDPIRECFDQASVVTDLFKVQNVGLY